MFGVETEAPYKYLLAISEWELCFEQNIQTSLLVEKKPNKAPEARGKTQSQQRRKEERERSGEEEPQKVHIQGREKDSENPNQPCASLAPNSLKAFHVCTWGGKKAVAVGREKKTLCERERERASKNHPGKTKYQRKKLKKLDHLIPKPCTVNFLVPNYVPKRNTHTHTHTKKEFFLLLPNYARKKRKQKKKKKKKKKKEEETEQEKEGSGILQFLTNGGEGTRHT
jgi:hypothetical protein